MLLHATMQFALRISNISRRQLYEMRQIVEAQVVALAAERANDKQLETIGKAVEEMRLRTGNPRAMADRDHCFHLAILAACGNEVFPRDS